MKIMFFTFSKIILAAIFLAAFSSGISAQIDAGTSSGLPRTEDYPKSIKETLAKKRIEEAKEKYEELLKNTNGDLHLRALRQRKLKSLQNLLKLHSRKISHGGNFGRMTFQDFFVISL